MRLLITIILAGIWGWFQPDMFPQAEYGYLFIVTSVIGGFFIGWVVATISNILE